MTGFHSELSFHLSGPTSEIVILVEPLSYKAWSGIQFDVPQGFQCDLASVPRTLAAIAPDWRQSARAGVLHDAAYRRRGFALTRRQADDLLLEALRDDGVDAFRARAMWLAVRAFAGRNFRAKPMDWRA